jgi:glycosyltransferase involved in cell wall biosynthesis/ribosomal protein S18 acetylase RimI-like enzyme
MTRRIRVAHVTTVDMTLRYLLLGQLKAIRDAGYEVTAISAPGRWTSELEAGGIRHLPWRGASRSWGLRSDGRAFVELLKLLRQERFDLVHTHNPKPGVLGRIAARLAGVPCVVNTVHGLYALPEDSRLKKTAVLGAESMAALFSDAELYQSSEDLKWVRRLHLLSARKTSLLGNGTDLEHFDPRAVTADRMTALKAELHIPHEAVVVGTVGRLVAEKGYRELFEAGRDIDNSHEVRFLIVGESDPTKPDRITAEEMQRAGDRFVFCGWREDVRDLLALMDIFVLPSWREGLPRSAIEAAAMGKPLILTDIRGCREVARNDVEGLLIPPRDARRLGAAINRLVGDPVLRKKMGAAARARAEGRFDETKVIDKVLATYRRAFQKKGLPAPDAGGATEIRLRNAKTTDAAALARLHREGMPGAFLPALGDGFLRQLYRALATDDDAVVTVAENGAGVVGFAAGVVSVGEFYRRFYRRYGVAAGFAAAPRLIRPSVMKRVIETARYPQNGSKLPDSELLSISIDPPWRSHGLGRKLAATVVDGLRDRGATAIKVLAAVENNDANRFYEGIGFVSWGELSLHPGSPNNVWLMECGSSSRSA